MRVARRRMMTGAMKLFDMVLMVVSFGAATLPVLAKIGPVSFEQFLQMRIKLENFIVFFVLLGFWHFIFSILGLYGSKRLTSRRAEVIDVVKATSVAAVFLLLSSFLLQFQMVTPRFVAIFWAVSTSVAVVTRVTLRTWQRRLRSHGRDSRNMLIVGSNKRAIEFAKTVQSKPELGYRIIGFADEEWAGTEELRSHGWSLVCNQDDLRTFLRRSVVDEVVLAVPLRSFHDLASDVAAMCEQQGILLRVLSDLFNLRNTRSIADDFDGATMITQAAGITEGWPTVIKRGLDILLSLVLLICVAPVLLLSAILIRLTSTGPVFFVQKRIGLNKRVFSIYKFRTMVPDAEKRIRDLEHLNEVSGPVFKIKNDPRITPIGKFLRKTSIDELPQLFNVLKGNMSLVGPRPLPVRDCDGFDKDWQRRRFSVRPGITCLWQINGRNSIPFEKWMQLDLEYIDMWSLRLDFEILLRTIPAVLKGSGAA